MPTMAATQSDFTEALKSLVHLDYNAIEAYDAAIERLEAPDLKSTLREFREDHLRHTREVGELIRARGETPPDSANVERVLTEGKVVISGLAGDKATLKAMKTNEDDTNKAYERAVNHEHRSADALPILERGLADERRHRAWLEQRLAAL